MKTSFKQIFTLLVVLICFISVSPAFALNSEEPPPEDNSGNPPPPPDIPPPPPITNENGQPVPGATPQTPPACNGAACLPPEPVVINPPTPGGTPVPTINPTIDNGGLMVGSKMSMSVNSPSYADIPIMGSNIRTTQDNLSIKVNAVCFPTNLRAVANPVSPTAKIRMQGLYSIASDSVTVQNKRFYLEFPARAVMMEGMGTDNYVITNDGVSVDPPPVALWNKIPQAIARVSTDYLKSKKTFASFISNMAFALVELPGYLVYEDGGDGGVGGCIDCGGGGGGGGGGSIIPPPSPQSPSLNGPGYHMWFEDLATSIQPTGGVVNRQVLVNLPSASSISIDYGSGDINTAAAQFRVSNLGFVQEVAPPTEAELAAATTVQKYQIAAANYRAVTGQPYWISYVDWRQSIYNNAYMGVSGPIGQNINSGPQPNVSISQSPDGKSFEIFASLPGDLTMCGGYYSPLMVFFDKKYPHFENITSFKMMHDYKTYWPQADHNGYFIGVLNKNKKIESYKDLFGEDENIANGFDNLARYDLNKDGKIDTKDPIFKKLVLWKDKKGLGVFDKKDTILLSRKIKSIDLKYKNHYEMAGIGAEFRQRAQFKYVSKGKVKTGEVIDVWLKPFHGQQDNPVAKNK